VATIKGIEVLHGGGVGGPSHLSFVTCDSFNAAGAKGTPAALQSQIGGSIKPGKGGQCPVGPP